MNKLILTLFSVISLSSIVLAAPWDFLREPMSQIDNFSPIFIWALFFVSLVLLFISVNALNKKKSEKLAWVTGAFGLFSLKAFLVLADLYLSPGNFMNSSVQAFFDLLILGVLFIALFRK